MIILVVLAAVTIITLQQSKMIGYAVNGTQNYQKGQQEEMNEIGGLENIMESTLTELEKIQSGNAGTDPDNPNPPEEVLPDGWNKNKVYAVESDDNVKVPVPIGFTPSNVAGEKKVKQDL